MDPRAATLAGLAVASSGRRRLREVKLVGGLTVMMVSRRRELAALSCFPTSDLEVQAPLPGHLAPTGRRQVASSIGPVAGGFLWRWLRTEGKSGRF